MIHFKKIRFKNFLSFGEQPTEISFDHAITTLITGKNGAGKSVFLDALTFVLYNKPFRKINKPQLVNSVNNKGTVVEIWFKIGNKEYYIKRGIKPNVFEIHENEELLDQDGSANDYQAHLENNILKMNYTAFTQIVILGKATYVPFMRLTTPERRQVIEDLLGLSIFSTMNKVLKTKVSELKQKRIDNESDIRVATSEIASEERFIEQARVNREQNVKRIQTTIEELELRAAGVDGRIASLETNKAAVHDSVNDIRATIPEASKAAEKALQEAEKAQEERDDIAEPDDRSAINSKITDLRGQRDRLKEIGVQIKLKSKDILEMREFLANNETCPTCQQPIDENFRLKEVGVRNTKLSKLEDGRTKLKSELSGVDGAIQDAEALLDAITEQEEKIRTADKKIQKAQLHVQECQRKVQEINKEIERTQARVDEIEEQIKTERDGTKEFGKLISTQKKALTKAKKVDIDKEQVKLQGLKESLENHEKGKIELLETGSYLTTIGGMLKDSGIKTLILQKYLPIFNKLINQYLNQMGFFVQFELNEQFEETILSRFRDKFSYASFSEGQKLRIDLAILLTWRDIARLKNSLNTNLLIMDEVFDSSMDQAGVDAFVNMIPNMQGANIFVVSHTPDKLVDKFRSHIHFEMDGNFSKMS